MSSSTIRSAISDDVQRFRTCIEMFSLLHHDCRLRDTSFDIIKSAHDHYKEILKARAINGHAIGRS